jgi:sigma-B regulation protein RsbU (phosphoserine phosphatase)
MTLLANLTRIQVALPQSRSMSSYIISNDGSVFASADELNMLRSDPIKGNALVNKALQRTAPSGFISDFTDKSKKQKVGSFAQTPGKMALYVIVERDRKAAFQVLTRMYVTSVVWGILILLIATMGSFLSAGSVTKHLRELVVATKQIAAGDFGVRLQPISGDEVAELGHSVNNMASRIQSLMNTEVEKARFEKELETAKMVQSTFFPKKAIQTSNLAVTGSYQPATECGGDLWGHYSVREGIDLVFIADAMGHGAPAALVTAIAYATCQSVSSILRDSPIDPSPAVLLNRLNQIILDAVDGKISMTFFAALIDFNQGKMTYSNAGHNFPFVLTNDKGDSRLGKSAKKSAGGAASGAITLTLQGTPLGVDREAVFKEKEFEFRAGDKIFFFTDGLIENHLKGQSPIGRKNLLDGICAFGTDPIDKIQEKTLALAKTAFGDQNLQDDVTIVVAEISPSWVKPASASPVSNLVSVAPSMSIAMEATQPALTLDLGAPVAIPATAGIVSFDLGEPIPETGSVGGEPADNDPLNLKIKLPGVS